MDRHRHFRSLALVGILLLAAGCSSDGQFTLLGYTTRPTYDPNIRTVYVPIFGNYTYDRGLEFEMTKAVIAAIESKTPMKTVSNCAEADTELIATIRSRRKLPNNTNQLGEVRDVEYSVVVEVTWRDLRTGRILSSPNGGLLPENQPDLPAGAKLPVVLIYPTANYIPELGGSNASVQANICRNAAKQIVHMMETWNCNCDK